MNGLGWRHCQRWKRKMEAKQFWSLVLLILFIITIGLMIEP